MRLSQEGAAICSALRNAGYQCHKQSKRLAWKLCSLGQDECTVEWLPSPVAEWSVLPNNTNPNRLELCRLVSDAVSAIRNLQLPPQTLHRHELEDYSRPWAIVRLLPSCQRYTVARFHTRSEADEYRRHLNRFMPAAEFEILFDVPTDELTPQGK